MRVRVRVRMGVGREGPWTMEGSSQKLELDSVGFKYIINW